MEILESVKKAMLAGLGVPEKLKEVVDDLVKRGEMSESQGSKLIVEWTERAEKSSDDLSKNVTEFISTTMDRMSLPRKVDMDTLMKEMESLRSRVAALEEKTGI